MSAEPWPTEDAATKAVDAAARAYYDEQIKARREVFPPSAVFPTFDELEPEVRLGLREGVLPLVWAAVAALPDPRYATWTEGVIAGGNGLDTTDNPYPSGL